MIKTLILISVTCFCLYIAIQGIDWPRLWLVFSKVNVGLFLMALPILFGSYWVRSVRWKYLFPLSAQTPGLSKLFSIMMIGFFGNNLLPARAGEMARVLLVGQYQGISRFGALSTIVTERTFDGIILSIIGLLAIQQVGLDGFQWITIVGAVFFICFLILLLLGVFRERAKQLLLQLSRKFPGHLSGKICSKLQVMLDYLESLFTIRGFLMVLFLSTIIWGLEIIVYSLIAGSFQTWLSLGQLGIFLASVNFASLAPTLPGGIGAIEMVGTESLVVTGLPRETALAMVLAQHFLQYFFCLVLGIYFLKRSKISIFDLKKTV